MGATQRNLQARPKILKKIIEIQTQLIRIKIYQKKVCLVPSKCKGAKNSNGSYPKKFVSSTQKPKKLLENQINQLERTPSQK
jgi:hypothetical protein